MRLPDCAATEGFKPAALAIEDLTHAFQHANAALLAKDANVCERQLSSLASQASKKSQTVEPGKGDSLSLNIATRLMFPASMTLKYRKTLASQSDAEFQLLSKGVSIKGDAAILASDSAKTSAYMDTCRAQLDDYDVLMHTYPMLGTSLPLRVPPRSRRGRCRTWR